MELFRLTRSGRRHHPGKAHILAALRDAGEPVNDDGGMLLFIGVDDRGVEIEIGVVPDDRYPGSWAVIHAMPTGYRRNR